MNRIIPISILGKKYKIIHLAFISSLIVLFIAKMVLKVNVDVFFASFAVMYLIYYWVSLGCESRSALDFFFWSLAIPFFASGLAVAYLIEKCKSPSVIAIAMVITLTYLTLYSLQVFLKPAKQLSQMKVVYSLINCICISVTAFFFIFKMHINTLILDTINLLLLPFLISSLWGMWMLTLREYLIEKQTQKY